MNYYEEISVNDTKTAITFKSKLHTHKEYLFNKEYTYYYRGDEKIQEPEVAICTLLDLFFKHNLKVTVSGKSDTGSKIIATVIESSEYGVREADIKLKHTVELKPIRDHGVRDEPSVNVSKGNLRVKYSDDYGNTLLYVINIDAIETITATYSFQGTSVNLVEFNLKRNHEGFKQNTYLGDSMFDVNATFLTNKVASMFFKDFNFYPGDYEKLPLINEVNTSVRDPFTDVCKVVGHIGALQAAFYNRINDPTIKFFRDSDRKDKIEDYTTVPLAAKITCQGLLVQPLQCTADAFSTQGSTEE